VTHRCWFFHNGRFCFEPCYTSQPLVPRGAQPTDAVAAGGSWRVDNEQPLHISFSPGWCERVIMRDCRRETYPDGTVEVQSDNVEVRW